MGYLQIGLAIALATLLGLFLNAERRLGNAQEEIGRLKTSISAVAGANDSTKASLDTCLSTNKENKAQREAIAQLISEATDRVVTLTSQLEAMNEPIISNDTDCRTLTDLLPSDFTNSLCIGTANCSQD